jgi:hypothetical protein
MWSSDKNTPSTTNSDMYPPLFNQPQPMPVNDCAKVQKMDHLYPASSFSGDDLLYGQHPQVMSLDPSPGYVQSENSSHSNQPTPSSSSNRPGSYSTFTPPQQNSSGFSPTASAATSEAPLFGSNLGGNMAMPSANDGSSWTFTAVHQSQDKKGTINGEQQNQQQQQQPNEMAFGGGTGMTPGATGMTPLPDSLWQSVNEGAGSEWMYGWSAGMSSQ